MSGFSLLDVQQSLYDLLHQDSVLVAMGWQVFDHVEENEELPFIVLDSDGGTDNSAKGLAAMTVDPELHFWSRDRGYKTMKESMKRVYDLLHMKSNLLIAGQAIRSHVAMTRCMTDPDGITRHGVMRLRIFTYDAG